MVRVPRIAIGQHLSLRGVAGNMLGPKAFGPLRPGAQFRTSEVESKSGLQMQSCVLNRWRDKVGAALPVCPGLLSASDVSLAARPELLVSHVAWHHGESIRREATTDDVQKEGHARQVLPAQVCARLRRSSLFNVQGSESSVLSRLCHPTRREVGLPSRSFQRPPTAGDARSQSRSAAP